MGPENASKRRKLNGSSETSVEKTYNPASSVGPKPSRIQIISRIGSSDFKEEALSSNTDGVLPSPRYQSADNANAFNPDVFKLQTDELLADVNPYVDSCLEKARPALLRIKDAIEQMPASGPILATEAERLLQKQSKIKIPFPEPRPNKSTKSTLHFARPASVNVLEIAAEHVLLGQDDEPFLDMVLTMPSDIFQDKDYLNHRYFHKRAFYIACVAAGLSKAFPTSIALKFGRYNGNALQPVLIVSQVHGDYEDGLDLSGSRVRVLATASFDLFPLKKTLPWQNCVRTHTAMDSNQIAMPTPFYNSTIRLEISLEYYSGLLHQTLQRVTGFQGASTLLTLWLRQRGFGSDLSRGGFGAFESSLIMALLLQTRGQRRQSIFKKGFDHNQLFKAFIFLLRTRDLVRSPMILDGEQLGTGTDQALVDTPIFLDGKRGLNLLFKMSPWSYKQLRYEASATLAQLNDASLDSFRDCFIARIDNPMLQSDYVIRLTLPPPPTITPSSPDSKGHIMDAIKRIYSALEEALGDRVRLMSFEIQPWMAWNVRQSSHQKDTTTIKVHFMVHPENLGRTVDRGPSAEDKESTRKFCQFWGPKAELRRFRDGSITQSLVWTGDGSQHSVLMQIIRYIMARRFGSEVADSIALQDNYQMENLPAPATMQNRSPSGHIWESFSLLKQQIGGLEGLPLPIRQVSLASTELGLGPGLSLGYGAKFGNDVGSGRATVVLQFESSARWPDDIEAIQRTKIALLLKLGKLLEYKDTRIRTKLGLENETLRFLNKAFLDVKTSKHTFRLRTYHDRELLLIERQLMSVHSTPSMKETAVHAVSLYKSAYINSPAHAEAIRSLCIKHSMLLPSIQLLKYWFSSHLLLPHFEAEFIELVATSPFTQPQPYDPPGSIRTGFLRAIARLAQWNWRKEPLFVNLLASLTNEDKEAVQTRLEAWRSVDPAMNRSVLLVGTPLDKSGTAWTERCPTKVVAARLIALAKATLSEAMSGKRDFGEKPLFASSFRSYDFLIHVDLEQNPEHFLVAERTPNSSRNDHDAHFSVTSNPIDAFVHELEHVFGDNILLMHNGLKQSTIAGLWNPAAGPRKWKVNLPFSSMPRDSVSEQDEQDSSVAINKAAILHEIARLGGNMVSKIEIFRPLTV